MSQRPFENFMIRYRGGEAIFSEGDPGSTMFIVQSGRIELFQQLGDDKHSLGVMEKGDFFGEMSIIEGLPRTHFAEALDDAELIEINNMIFGKMIRANIEIAVRMLRKLSIRLREAETRLSKIQLDLTSAPPAAATPVERSAASCASLESEDDSVVFELALTETMIGRFDPVTGLKPDIDLTDMDLKRSVSRQHARIVLTDSGHLVFEEVGALNGTYLNDMQLVAGQGNPIEDGDRLRVGSVGLVFRI